MERNLEEPQVFSGRTFSLLIGKDIDWQAALLELYELDNTSYAIAFVYDAQLVVNDSWRNGTAALPLEARVWFKEADERIKHCSSRWEIWWKITGNRNNNYTTRDSYEVNHGNFDLSLWIHYG